MKQNDIGAIILAAGLGKRMKSKLIKILHPICGQPMIAYVLDTLNELGIQKRVIVLGHQRERVAGFLNDRNEVALLAVEIAVQEKLLGTGDAVKSAERFFDKGRGDVLVLSGDTPLISKDTLERLIETHHSSGAEATILTSEVQNPTGYGRLIKNNKGYVLRIVEETDASSEERAIKTINTGTYCFKVSALFAALKMVSPANAQGLAVAETYLRKQILNDLMDNGVTIISPETVFIDRSVSIGQDTVIYPFTAILGQSVIGKDCVIGPHACIIDAIVGDKATVVFQRI
ncbi:NTP transferase domain-containing protein [Candidatus Desantisbacteria bacterium]|nr:NTP transferase domain-containing protein [Candidatus Desantisbacteria bacterium]